MLVYVVPVVVVACVVVKLLSPVQRKRIVIYELAEALTAISSVIPIV